MLLRLFIAAIFFSAALCPVFSQDTQRDVSLPEYLAELDRVSAAAGNDSRSSQAISEVVQNLPDRWRIRNGNKTYTVQGEWLKSSLLEIQKNNSPEAAQTLQSRIASLRADARELSAKRRNFSSDRQALNRILARREFRKIHSPTFWDRLKQKIQDFLFRLLNRIFGSSAFPEISRIIIWLLVGIAIIVFAVWIYRTLRRAAGMESLRLAENMPVSALSWTEWLARAQAAAAAGNWRDAVHLAYWGGISFLESSGLWTPDRARTPREYLRMLPAASGHREPLFALTRKFEAVWYGRAAAGPESFAESLRDLERMGCR